MTPSQLHHHAGDADASLPCPCGLLAATLALMTAWAAPDPQARIDAHGQRVLLARKIAANLRLLCEHPDVGPGMRRVTARLHLRWQAHDVASLDLH